MLSRSAGVFVVLRMLLASWQVLGPVEVEGPLERGVAGGENEASGFQDGSHALR